MLMTRSITNRTYFIVVCRFFSLVKEREKLKNSYRLKWLRGKATTCAFFFFFVDNNKNISTHGNHRCGNAAWEFRVCIIQV